MTVCSRCENPYFNRTAEHFCSHQHTPNNPNDSHPIAVSGKDGIYMGYNIFEEYALKGSITAKEIVCELLDMLLSEKTIMTNLPSQGIVQMSKQGERYIIHLLYASPVKRGESIEVIEDILPIKDTIISVKLPDKPKNIYLAPQKKDVEFEYKAGRVEMKVDSFECHQMVVLDCND